MDKVVVYGAGGCGRGVHQIAEDAQVPVVGWLDDDPARLGTTEHGLLVLGGAEWLQEQPSVSVILGVGSPAVKVRIVGRIPCHTDVARLTHPRAWVAARASVGDGTVIFAGAMVNAGATIGRFTTINMSCTVGHDVLIEDFVTLAPGVSLSGYVRIGAGAELGAGAVVIPGRSVGAGAMIGAGAVVISDIPAGATAVGVPARVIKERIP